MTILPALTLALSYVWGAPAPSIELGAGGYAWNCRARTEVQAQPLILTWSPEDGFGARSDAEVNQYAGRMFWCER